MNAGAKSVAVTALSPLAGALVARVHLHDRWLYMDYSEGNDSKRVLLVLPGAIYDKATAKAQSLFGERVTIADYFEKGKPIIDKNGDIDKSRIPDLKSEHSMKLEKQPASLTQRQIDDLIRNTDPRILWDDA